MPAGELFDERNLFYKSIDMCNPIVAIDEAPLEGTSR